MGCLLVWVVFKFWFGGVRSIMVHWLCLEVGRISRNRPRNRAIADSAITIICDCSRIGLPESAGFPGGQNRDYSK